MAVIQDVLEGDVTRSSAGITHTRTFIVTDLSGAGANRLAGALNIVPPDGDPHPSIPGIRVTNTTVKLEGRNNSIARVGLTYGVETKEGRDGEGGESGRGKLTANASTVSEEIDTDIYGKALETSYFNLRTFGKRTIRHRVQIERPTVSVQLSKQLSKFPREHVMDFTGAVNSRRWSGFDAKLWLCRGVSVSQAADGRYDVDYDFAYNKQGWMARVVTKVDGLIPLDIKAKDLFEAAKIARERNGISTYDVMPLKDFNQLKVRF